MTRLLFLAASLALTPPAAAEPGLLPEAVVREALDAHPSVIAARARVDVAAAEKRALEAGPYEFSVTGSYVSRSIDREGRFNEYDAILARPVRLPGKARLDRKAGALGVEAATNHFEDARHQAALLLNALWWDWVGASAEAVVDAQGVENYATLVRIVRRRVDLRDAPQLEADQAEAALAEARLLAAQSAGRADLARARLAAQFPGVALPVEAPTLATPTFDPAGASQMRDQVIERSHEIAAADAEARRFGALAERGRQDRIPDPTVGLRLFSERSGAERGAGLTVTIPIGGNHRGAMAARAASEAQAAAAQLSAVRFDVQEMADGDLARAAAAYSAWQRADQARAAQMAALAKLRRGQDLDAIDLADVLLGERQTHASFRAETIARTEALRDITRLRIDSHNLWISE